MKNFSELLEELREERQISKKDLALHAGLTPGYVSLLTRGERTAPSEETVVALAGVLDLDKETRIAFFRAAGYQVIDSSSDPHPSLHELVRENVAVRTDLGEAPDVRYFFGRQKELITLEDWIQQDSCRVVSILGIGGIGKTSLAAKLMMQIKDSFDFIFWRSLQDATPIETILLECIQFLSDKKHIDLPEEEEYRLSALFDFLLESLRNKRCLVVLDNFESVLQGGARAGEYRHTYEGYGRLIRYLGEIDHRSCLVLTSREKPEEIALLEGKTWPVRSLLLSGLGELESQELLKDRGLFGSDDAWVKFISLYSGNPLALKLISEPIREVFGGNIADFLKEKETVFGNIQDLLDQQFRRLSELEQVIMYWLGIEREPVPLEGLYEDIIPQVSKKALLEALNSLLRRSMIETSGTARFILQPVIMEYMTEKFVDQVYEEIKNEAPILLGSHALIKAQAKDYVRNSQARLILVPVTERLLTFVGREKGEYKLKHILSTLQGTFPQKGEYIAGNLLNLLIQMQADLRGSDFSLLMVREAYLQGISLPEVNFSYTSFAKTVFTDSFGNILSVAISPNGQLLAIGTTNGEIRLWQITDSILLHTFLGHFDWIRSIAFSPDGKLLASGSDDQTVRLWEVSSGQCLKVLQGHTDRVYSVAFSPDGRLLVSGSQDRTARLWEVSSGQCLKVLQGHTSLVYSVAFSPDGKLLVSGSDDRTVRLWEVSSGQCLKVLQDHTDRVYSVAFSPDGRLLVSGSQDRTARLWEVSSGQCLKVLQGHTSLVYSVAFSPDGKLLASGSDDRTARLWEVSSGQCLKVLQGHTDRVYSVVFSPDGKLLVSGSDDRTARLWEVSSGQCLKVLQGYTNRVYSVAFSPDGKLLASGSDDRTARLWEVSSGQCLKVLQGHTSLVYSVAFSPDGRLLVSGSQDQTARLWEVSSGQCLKVLQGYTNRVYLVAFSPDGRLLASGGQDRTARLWEVSSGQCLKVLQGHTDRVRSVAFSPDGKLLASGSDDRTVRLWEVSSGQCLKVLQGHTAWVWSVAFSPDGKLLASGSDDRTVRLWEVSSGQCLKVLQGHTDRLWSVAFSPDGKLLASGSQDRTARLWEVSSGQCLKVLQGHTNWVYSVVFSPDGKLLVSGSHDGTIKFWDILTVQCVKTLRSERPYERMMITNASGITEAQKTALKILGAIEEQGTGNKRF